MRVRERVRVHVRARVRVRVRVRVPVPVPVPVPVRVRVHVRVCLWDPSCMNISPNGGIWTCFGSIFMIFLQNLAFSNLHTLYIRCMETVYLLRKDHAVSVCHCHNSGNPYHPSTATGLQACQSFFDVLHGIH